MILFLATEDPISWDWDFLIQYNQLIWDIPVHGKKITLNPHYFPLWHIFVTHHKTPFSITISLWSPAFVPAVAESFVITSCLNLARFHIFSIMCSSISVKEGHFSHFFYKNGWYDVNSICIHLCFIVTTGFLYWGQSESHECSHP